MAGGRVNRYIIPSAIYIIVSKPSGVTPRIWLEGTSRMGKIRIEDRSHCPPEERRREPLPDQAGLSVIDNFCGRAFGAIL